MSRVANKLRTASQVSPAALTKDGKDGPKSVTEAAVPATAAATATKLAPPRANTEGETRVHTPRQKHRVAQHVVLQADGSTLAAAVSSTTIGVPGRTPPSPPPVATPISIVTPRRPRAASCNAGVGVRRQGNAETAATVSVASAPRSSPGDKMPRQLVQAEAGERRTTSQPPVHLASAKRRHSAPVLTEKRMTAAPPSSAPRPTMMNTLAEAYDLATDHPWTEAVAIVPSKKCSTPAPLAADDGYYLVSDGSANSSFSDTPHSARPASIGSSVSTRDSGVLPALDLNGQTNHSLTPTAPAAATARLEHEEKEQEEATAAPSAPAGHHHRTNSSCSRSSEGSEESAFGYGGDGVAAVCEMEEDGAFNEEQEEQAVRSYMDSCVDPSRRTAGSISAASPGMVSAPAGRSVGDDLAFCLEVASAMDAAAANEQPTHDSTTAAAVVVERLHASPREASSGNNSSAAAVMAGRRRSGEALPPPPLPTTSGSPTALSRQPSAAPPPCSSSRRSPPQKPSQLSPQNLSSLNLHGTASPHAEEEMRERTCRHLSLHEAFFFNQTRSFWLVDDHVLAKVLEYVRLMGYEHPALQWDRKKGHSSLWSTSSAISSPIAPGKYRRKASSSSSMTAAATSATPRAPREGKEGGRSRPSSCSFRSPHAASMSAADTAASPPSASAASPDSMSTSPKQYHLRSNKPHCTGQYASTTSSSATHLFLTFQEAMRWIVEQEYVIGTVLMCCARFIGEAEADGAALLGDGTAEGGPWHPRRAMLQRGKPCIPVRMHPIHYVTSLILIHYPQWGGMPAFVKAWETQIRLVLGSAAPNHQCVFKLPDDGLVLSSDLEAGNLQRVERGAEPYNYMIWLEADPRSDKRLWFRFSVTGAKEGRTLRFRLMNAAPHMKLYRRNNMCPVWRDGLSQPQWGPVDSCSFRTTNRDMDGEISFAISPRNSTETIQVAFCTPYSYADLLCHICHWHALVKSSVCDMRFEERVLCRSPEGRKLHLLIVTSRTGGAAAKAAEESKKEVSVQSNSAAALAASPMGAAGAAVDVGRDKKANSTPSTVPAPIPPPVAVSTGRSTSPRPAEEVHGPYSNFSSGKKVILVSGRVHPGEVTASHGVHGLISFILSSDPRAIKLREHFIFFVVPMLNPDGVSRGHSRMDQFGSNLNRCYNTPDPETQPTVLALRRVYEHLQSTYRERFIMYLDFHSHASQSSGFVFGNNLPVRVQHWNLFFPRLVDLQARHVFSFSLCRFGRAHMISKIGASRVLFGSSLIHSYTVELTHFTNRRVYADDWTAMNNGSDVLGEVTWPPVVHRTPTGTGSVSDTALAATVTPTASVRAPNIGIRSGATVASTFGKRRVTAPTSGSGGTGRSTTRGILGAPKKPRANTATVLCGSSPPSSSTAAEKQQLTPSDAKKLQPVVGTSTASSQTGAAAEGETESGRPSGDSAAPSAGPATAAPSLQSITTPTVLCDSAEVGRACLLALLDYCSLDVPSYNLAAFGGMKRVLTDVRAHMRMESPMNRKGKKSQAAETYAGLEPIYKQY